MTSWETTRSHVYLIINLHVIKTGGNLYTRYPIMPTIHGVICRRLPSISLVLEHACCVGQAVVPAMHIQWNRLVYVACIYPACNRNLTPTNTSPGNKVVHKNRRICRHRNRQSHSLNGKLIMIRPETMAISYLYRTIIHKEPSMMQRKINLQFLFMAVVRFSISIQGWILSNVERVHILPRNTVEPWTSNKQHEYIFTHCVVVHA